MYRLTLEEKNRKSDINAFINLISSITIYYIKQIR
jgi:hypothetical protein